MRRATVSPAVRNAKKFPLIPIKRSLNREKEVRGVKNREAKNLVLRWGIRFMSEGTFERAWR